MNKLIRVQDDVAMLDQEFVLKIIGVEEKIKELKEIQDEYKKELMRAMSEKGIVKLVDDITGMSITYIEAKDNLEKFHQQEFRNDHPDLYDEYVTMDGKKTAYITIRIK